MSLPWIKLFTDLPDHHKSDHLEAVLGVPRAWTHLVELWLWAARMKPTGNLTGVDDAIIAKRAGWVGDAAGFVEALRVTGWLDEDNALHGWDEHQCAHLAKVERDRERMRARRAKSDDRSATVARPSRDRSATVAGERRGEESRGEEKREEGEKRAASPALPPKPVAALAQEEPEDLPPAPEDRQEARARGAVIGEAHRARSARVAASEAIYDRPQTVRQFLEFLVGGKPGGKPVRALWSERYPQLDGRSGRPTLEEFATVLWDYSLRQRWGVDGGPVMAWWALKLGEEARKHARGWEADGGTRAADPDRAAAKRRHHQLQGRGKDVAKFETWFAECWARGIDREDFEAPYVDIDDDGGEVPSSGPTPSSQGSGAPLRGRIPPSTTPVHAQAPVYEADDGGGLAMMRAAITAPRPKKPAAHDDGGLS